MADRGGGSLRNLIDEKSNDFSDSERVLASFLLADQQNLPFETASSIARKVGVSAVTVGRFCRTLGFNNFRELKAALRYEVSDAPWPSDERRTYSSKSHARLRRDRDMTMAGIDEVYGMVDSAEWNAIVSILDSSEEVIVAGFQTERGIAEHFAHMLQYVRAGVRLADLGAGNFADVLIDDRRRRCVVIIETRRYSRQARRLAEHAASEGLTLIVVTDKFCHWARNCTPHVLALPDESALFFSTLVPMLAALTLLVQEVVMRRGDAASPRLRRISELYQDFVGHDGHKRGSDTSQGSARTD